MSLIAPGSGENWVKARLGRLSKRIDEVKRGVNEVGRRAARSPISGTTAERDAAYGTPTGATSRRALAEKRPLWHNSDTGRAETYLATASDGAAADVTAMMGSAGWYPVFGATPTISLFGGEQSVTSPEAYTGWFGPGPGDGSWRNTSELAYDGASYITIGIAGRYRVGAHVGVPMGTGAGVITLDIMSSSNTLRRRTARYAALDPSYTQVLSPTFENTFLRAGDKVRVTSQQGTWVIGGSETQIAVIYLAPPVQAR